MCQQQLRLAQTLLQEPNNLILSNDTGDVLFHFSGETVSHSRMSAIYHESRQKRIRETLRTRNNMNPSILEIRLTINGPMGREGGEKRKVVRGFRCLIAKKKVKDGAEERVNGRACGQFLGVG